MAPILAFLPVILPYNGNWPSLQATAHQVFRDDFFVNGVFDGDVRVVVDNSIGPDGLENGFTHIVTRCNGHGTRGPDVMRARRIGWIKPIIENAGCGEVGYRHWRHTEGHSDVRRYYWAERDDFVVVVAERGRAHGPWFLVSSFYITHQAKRADLETRYKRRL